MEDRFRFRLWNTLTNKYEYDIETSEVPLIEHVDGWGHILEQCTGLKDRNNTFIYEGDIVRAINQDTEGRPDLQIGHIWSDELGCRWITFKKEELSWNDFCSLVGYDLTLTIQVIGNIHENQDLMSVGR